MVSQNQWPWATSCDWLSSKQPEKCALGLRVVYKNDVLQRLSGRQLGKIQSWLLNIVLPMQMSCRSLFAGRTIVLQHHLGSPFLLEATVSLLFWTPQFLFLLGKQEKRALPSLSLPREKNNLAKQRTPRDSWRNSLVTCSTAHAFTASSFSLSRLFASLALAGLLFRLTFQLQEKKQTPFSDKNEFIGSEAKNCNTCFLLKLLMSFRVFCQKTVINRDLAPLDEVFLFSGMMEYSFFRMRGKGYPGD